MIEKEKKNVFIIRMRRSRNHLKLIVRNIQTFTHMFDIHWPPSRASPNENGTQAK